MTRVRFKRVPELGFSPVHKPELNGPSAHGPHQLPWWHQPELLDASKAAISKTRFKAQALELLRQVEATGTPLLISDHGRPCLEVRRYTPAHRPNPLDQLRGSLGHFHDPLLPPA